MKKTLTLLFLLTTFFSNYIMAQQDYNITLAGKSSGTITLEEITKARRISIDNDSIKITSFTLSALEQGFLIEIAEKSDSFSDKCYTIFPKIKGGKFFIENIKGITKSGRTFYLGSLAFKLTP